MNRRKLALGLLLVWLLIWLGVYLAGLIRPQLQPALAVAVRSLAFCTPAVATVIAFLMRKTGTGKMSLTILSVFAAACLLLLAISFLWPGLLPQLTVAAVVIAFVSLAAGLLIRILSGRKT